MSERLVTRRGPILWLWGRSWRFWIAVALLLPVLYVASFGPAMWLIQDRARRNFSVIPWDVRLVAIVYQPLGYKAIFDPAIGPPLARYAALCNRHFVAGPRGEGWVGTGWAVCVPVSSTQWRYIVSEHRLPF